MKAIKLLLVSFLVVCVSTTNVVASKKSSENESDAAKIQRAMKAAPSSISAHARILGTEWNGDKGDWNELREATNGNTWTCFPGVPLNEGDKHPMCNDEVWMDWLYAVVNLFDTGVWLFETETVGYSYMLRGDARVDNNDPSGLNPDGLWDQEGPHLMLLYPDSVPLPSADSPHDGGPYVMWGDPSFDLLKHVMVPLTDRDR